MAVIREDVVSIGFQVENNPFAEITAGINEIRVKLGILDETEGGLKGVAKEARTAGSEVGSLTDDLNSSPANELSKPVQEAGKAAQDAQKDVSGLGSEMVKTGKIKLADGLKALASGLKNPKEGFRSLAGTAKKFAKEKLDTGIKKLPPPLQTGVKASGKLLGALGKVAGMSMKTVVSGVKSLGSHAASAAKSLGQTAVKGAAKGAVVGIAAATTAVTGMGAASIKVGAEFEASMSQVAATMGMTSDEADYSNATYSKLADTAKQMGATTKFSASESAEALNYMALAGYDADKSCAALPTVLNLAASGGMELAAASDMVTDSMSALGIEATQENLTRFGDQLAKTAQKSNTSVAQLGEAVLTVGGTAKSLAGGTTELNTLLGIIADNGVKGAEGGTALRNIMLSLQSPTDVAAKKMKSLGLSVYDAEGKMRPMNDILTDLNSSVDGMTDQQKQDAISTIFNKNDLKSVSALLAGTAVTTNQLKTSLTAAGYDVTNFDESLNGLVKGFDKAQSQEDFVAGAMRDFGMTSDQAGVLFTGLTSVVDGSSTRFNELSGYVADSEGAMADMAETMNDNLQGRMTEFGSAAEGAGIAVYEALGSGNLKGLVEEATGWVTDLTRATEEGGLEGLASQLGTTLTNVLMSLTGYLPKLVEYGVSIIKSLISGVMQNREQITGSVMEGITSMVTGILQTAPDILALGGMLLMSLVQGLQQQLPALIPLALTAIQNLCNGLIQNGPAIIQSGINIIMQLLNGLIAAAPTILTTGIQLVIMLVQGLIAAIPQLIQAIPHLIGAIITTLMSVDWLKLGLDIVKGIGGGIISGVKGLFSKGKDAGKEAGDGVAEGLNESASQLTAAADATTSLATDSFAPDTAALGSYGVQMPGAVAAGIQEGAGAMEGAAGGLWAGVSDTWKGSMDSTVTETQPALSGLLSSCDQTFTDMNTSASGSIELMGTGIQTGFTGMVSDAGTFSGDFKSEIDQTDLYQSGVNIMQGLDNGLNSMRGSLVATARGIADDVKNTVNGSLDIHSPSRVMEESGEYTGLGLVKGLENLSGKVIRTAGDIGDETAYNMSPSRSRYSPEISQATDSRNTSEVNNYGPVFNLTLNGASASDSNERKVKRWVKDAMNEAMRGMGRTNPRLREV